MRKKIHIFGSVLLVGFILISCDSAKSVSNETVRYLNPPDKPLQEDPLYNNVAIIKLETSQHCLIDNIKRIEMNDSFIFVLDSYHLYEFTREGDFVTEIGKKGEGPGEYIVLSKFYVDNEKQQICILDDFKDILIYYDFKGKHLSTISVPERSFQSSNYALLAEDNKLLLFHMMDMYDTKAYSIFDLNKKKVSERYFPYHPITVGNYIYSFTNHPMTRINDDIDIIMPLCDTIFTYSAKTSSFHVKYIIETPQKMAPKNRIRKKTPYYTQDISKLAKEGFFTGFTGIFETSKKVLLEYRDQGVIVGYFLFDKDTKTGNYHLSVSNNKAEVLPFFYTIYSYKDVFVGCETAQDLLCLKNIKDKKVREVIESLKEDDNPCLFLYELK